MTSISARCVCGRLYSVTFEPSRLILAPVELQCECGKVTPIRIFRSPVETSTHCHECKAEWELHHDQYCSSNKGRQNEFGGGLTQETSAPQLTDAQNEAMDRDLMKAIKLDDAQKASVPRWRIKTGPRAGSIVYPGRDGYGCANEDTRNTGVEHTAVCDNESGEPFYTMPKRDLEAL